MSNPTAAVTRSQDEIYARAKGADDMFGWAQELLLPYLDFEHAGPQRDGPHDQPDGLPAVRNRPPARLAVHGPSRPPPVDPAHPAADQSPHARTTGREE